MEHQYDVRVAAVPSPSFPSTTAANSGHVRVLWDVENVSATCRSSNGSTLSGFESVQRLQTFLSGLGLHGPGVHSRITAFFSPGNSRVSQKTAQQLDKAGVEMVSDDEAEKLYSCCGNALLRYGCRASVRMLTVSWATEYTKRCRCFPQRKVAASSLSAAIPISGTTCLCCTPLAIE